MPVATISGLAAQVSNGLYERYRSLVASGPALALVEGGTVDQWLERLVCEGLLLGEVRVSTPHAFIRRELEFWWPVIEPQLPAGLRSDPLFVDVDLAQGLMARFSEHARGQLGDFEGARTPPPLRMVHLIDSIARGIENGIALSEIGDRLIRGTAHADEQALLGCVQPCLNSYWEEMLTHRLLDQGLSWHVYATHLLTDPGYRAALAELPALLVEAFDDATPLFQRVVREIAGLGVPLELGLRLDGGLREFLGADPSGAWNWAEREASNGQGAGREGSDGQGAEHNEAVGLQVSVSKVLTEIGDKLVRVESLNWPAMIRAGAVESVRLAAVHGPSEVAILVPAISPLLVSWLRGHLANAGLRMVVMAGGNRLSDHQIVRVLLNLGRVAIGRSLDRAAWLEVLKVATGVDPLELAGAADRLVAGDWSDAPLGGFDPLLTGHQGEKPQALEAFFRAAFASVVAAELPRDTGMAAVLGPVSKLVSAATRFREVEDRLGDDAAFASRMTRFLAWVDSGTIAEGIVRPDSDEAVVVLATASQFAQQGWPVQSHIWLDCDAPTWWKSDARELTNPQVLSVRWNGRPYGHAVDTADQERKLARVLFACAARCRGPIRAYFSPLGPDGNEQGGGL